MAWLDLEADIAELFDDADRRAASLAPPRVAPLRGRALRMPRPASRLGRIVAAIRGGARTPREIARAASLHVADVRKDLGHLKRSGRIRRGRIGWIL